MVIESRPIVLGICWVFLVVGLYAFFLYYNADNVLVISFYTLLLCVQIMYLIFYLFSLSTLIIYAMLRRMWKSEYTYTSMFIT